VQTHLVGRFNGENSTLVLACLLALGVPVARAGAALGDCAAPPGRMEIIPSAARGRPLAVVDYAHTPDALAKALAALREHCSGELWCVFGCGGDRDPAKRPMMGAVADELADRIIVTDDNPRTENPQTITSAIVAAIKRHEPQVIRDRAEAIGTALRAAGAADVVLIAGKGHEDYQIHGTTRRPFSDRREALRHLEDAA
jgi:UDP-N-acetylmuramoyl-L-alanyl-D-glutamate--2,6-diaminopimelate ligase